MFPDGMRWSEGTLDILLQCDCTLKSDTRRRRSCVVQSSPIPIHVDAPPDRHQEFLFGHPIFVAGFNLHHL